MDVEALERLGRLRASGALSENEFISEKQRILGVRPPTVDAESAAAEQEPLKPAILSDAQDTPSKRNKAPLLIVALGLVAAAGVAAYKYVLPQTSPASASSSYQTTKYSLRSKVRGIHIAPTTLLPVNPHGNDTSCAPYQNQPVGSAATLVASKEWHVTAEIPVGKFDAVSFVGACAPQTNNTFQPIDGNVGIYEGGQLRAVIYGRGIGYIERTDNPMQVRITDATNDRTFGRIVVTSQRISVLK